MDIGGVEQGVAVFFERVVFKTSLHPFNRTEEQNDSAVDNAKDLVSLHVTAYECIKHNTRSR